MGEKLMNLAFDGKINTEGTISLDKVDRSSMPPQFDMIMVPTELTDVDIQNTYVIRFFDNIVCGRYLAADHCPFCLVDRGSGYKVEWNSDEYNHTDDIVKAARYSMDDAYLIAEVLSNEVAFLDRCKISSIYDELKTGDDGYNLGKKMLAYAEHNIERISDSEQIKDNVNHPKHYENYSVECIVAMEETQGTEAVINFCICNAFKYLWRHRAKNGYEDIKKANWYLNKAVELCEKKMKEEK